MILRSAAVLTVAIGLRTLLATLPALGGALVLPIDDVADITLALAIVTPFFLASAMGIPQRVSTGDYGSGRYGQLHLARIMLAAAALPIVLAASLAFPMLAGWLVLGIFLTRFFEGQSEISTAILTRHDKPHWIAVTHAVMVGLYLAALVHVSRMTHAKMIGLIVATVAIAFATMTVLHLAARRYHDRTPAKGRMISRSLFEIRKGWSLGMADGSLSLVSYLPRYLLSAIGLHIAQGAFAIAQLLIRQFTIPTVGLLFARGGALLPGKGSDRVTLDRFLLLALGAASVIGMLFVAAFFVVREMPVYEDFILATLTSSQMLLSILVGVVFLLRFATWLLATRFLKGAQQLRIALWSGLCAVVTAALILAVPRFEVALATDIVANLVIVTLVRRAVMRTSAP